MALEKAALSSVVHVIDDDEALRESLTFLLRSAGLDVQSYSSARAFIDALPGLTLSCVITDLRMPDMSGIELMQHLKSLKIEPIVRADNFFVDDAGQLHCNCDQRTHVRHPWPFTRQTLPSGRKRTRANQSRFEPDQMRRAGSRRRCDCAAVRLYRQACRSCYVEKIKIACAFRFLHQPSSDLVTRETKPF
jgi:hypothetical protein